MIFTYILIILPSQFYWIVFSFSLEGQIPHKKCKTQEKLKSNILILYQSYIIWRKVNYLIQPSC